eukprot:8332411-Pyramimonas_sp.AAC.1
MLCAEWCTSVDSRRLSTVELKSVFLAVDSGAWYAISDAWTRRSPPKGVCGGGGAAEGRADA